MRRRASCLAVFGVVAAGALLASCGSSSPPPPGICGLPSGVQVALIYPEPGATAVPDGFSQIILAAQGTLPASYDAAVFGSSYNGFVAFGSVLNAPSPLPAPDATPPPSFTSVTYYTSTNPGITFNPGTSRQ